MNAKEILDGFSKAKADRLVVDNGWQDYAYYGFPRKRDVQHQKTEGEKQPTDVYDDTAIQSNLILAAGLSGYMTNAAQRWFELRSRDALLMNDGEVAKYFVESSDIIYSVLANSNFYQQIHEMYLDLGIFGMGCLYEEEDERDDIRFYSRKPAEIFCIENDKEIVDMVYRQFKMTAWQAYNFFGKDCGESVRKCVEEAKDFKKSFNFVHYVTPRYRRQIGKKDALNKPFASYWVSEADLKICKESGYDEFPFFIPRFYKTSGETYGEGPMSATYSNVSMINKMVELYYRGGELALWPAWLMEDDSMIGTLDLRAGAVNYQKSPLAQGAQVQALDSRAKFEIGIDFINRVEEKIKRAFFVDIFLMMTQNQNMTATEVIERSQERMLILGPVLGRMQSEFLNPVIYRTFNILARRGKLPPLPDKLAETGYDVVYVSPLAKAQRAVQARDMTTYLTIIGQMAQMAPDVMDKIDTDKVVDKLCKIYSVDPDIIRDEDEIDAIREFRSQQQAQQQQVMAAANMAQIYKTGAEGSKAAAGAELGQ